MRGSLLLWLAATASCARIVPHTPLRLRAPLRLRGGAPTRPAFVHGVVLGLVANSAAIGLSLALTLPTEERDGAPNPYAVLPRGLARVLIPVALCMVTSYVAYFVVYLLTGFVPMGFVPGAQPALGAFAPPASLSE